MVHQQSRPPLSVPDDDPQFFDYSAEEPENAFALSETTSGEQSDDDGAAYLTGSLGDIELMAPKHLTSGFEPDDLWRQPTEGSSSFDFGYSADQQSVNVYPLPTSYPGSSSLGVRSGPLGAGLSPVSDTPYSSGSSPMISAPLSIGLYTSQQDSPTLYSASGVPIGALQGYDYYSSFGFGLGTPESLVVPSPVVTETNLTDPEHEAYETEFSPGVEEASIAGSSGNISRNKRVRTAAEQDVSSAWSALPPTPRSLMAAGPVPASCDAATSKSNTRLRSASRTSKNVANKPDETSEERRTRNAHNIVEKQYRNRLNARFEGLLNVLPPSLRSSSSGNGESEVRLSKGDVLDMSTTYIRTLENQCSQLEKEREELSSNIDRLHSMLTNDGRSIRDGFSGEGS